MEESQRQYRTLILAGLLHDIGKLLNKPDPGGKKHAIFSVEFLRQSPNADLIKQRFARDIDFELLCYLVLRHDPYLEKKHLPADYDGPWDLPQQKSRLRCISLADTLSAGERSFREVYGEQAQGTRALDSIFTGLDLGRPGATSERKYPPVPLRPADAFPTTGIEPLTLTHYKPLQAAFETAFTYALEQARDWEELEAWVYSLLERYTWAVPSALHLEPRDVSLFDHARTSCAIAAAYALRRYSGQRAVNPTFLFLKADVSGVQDYIYSVANVGPGGVAKRLRARSFFVTALTEVVSHRLSASLVPGYRLPIAAKIFAGGGQFVLLAPNLQVVHERLATIEREVNEWLWRRFQGDLAVVFGKVAAGQKELAIKPGGRRTICEVLDELDNKIAEAKKHRLGVLLQQGKAWAEDAFKWEAERFDHGDCPSCQRLPARARDEEGIPFDMRLCWVCYQDRILSEQIVRADYIAYYEGAKPPRVKEGTDARDAERLRRSMLTLFDDETACHVVLLKEGDRERLDRPPYQLDGFGYEPPDTEEQLKSESPALVRHFANYVPRFKEKKDLEEFCMPGRGCVQISYDDDEMCGIRLRPDGSRIQDKDYPILQTFGCISAAAAEWEDGSLGTQLLGVLRADVDNLGWLFRRGIGQVKSLSRLATLSRMTDLFFSGWVNQVLTKPPPGTRYDRIYTVYSGGDDLCLVGPWDVVIDFARHMAKEFQRYVAGNPNVTISAAVAVTKPKFPIATSARAAYELLKEAKNAGRNRLNLFGVITRWSAEPDNWVGLDQGLSEQMDDQRKHAMLLLDELWPWAELLDEELRRWREARKSPRPTRYPISAAFAHQLLEYAEMARTWEEKAQINSEDLLYLARLAYGLGRNIIESEEVKEGTKRELMRLTHLSNHEVMAGMRLPITYAVYRNRERSREK